MNLGPCLSPRADRQSEARAFVLIGALLLLALLAGAMTALVGTLSIERSIARAHLDRFQAELAAESALAELAAALQGVGTRHYACGYEPGEEAPDRPLPALFPLAAGRVAGLIPLHSGAPPTGDDADARARILIGERAGKRGWVEVGYRTLGTADEEAARYAYWALDNSSKQNVNSCQGTRRAWLVHPHEIPLVAPDGASLPSGAAGRAPSGPSVVPSVDCLELIVPREGASWSEFDYAVCGRAWARDPEGRPRLDLRRLKRHVDGLALCQARGNPRARLVERLLGGASGGASEWGGGDLRILARLYSPARARQVAANLLDWIDADVVPTTDDQDAPAYFGFEGMRARDGGPAGHPAINFVGTGLVFNRSRSGIESGGLNSTRVLAFLGVVDPWPGASLPWEVFYRPEIEIGIEGEAIGGRLGTRAADYFASSLAERLGDAPVDRVAGHSGACFPGPVSGPAYSSLLDLLGTSGRQPPGMSFRGLGYRIRRLRLRYVGTDGAEGYVQILDRLGEIVLPAEPASVDLGTAGGTLLYKFSTRPRKLDLHLCSDLRLSFLPSSWTLRRSADAGPAPPAPLGSPLDPFAGVSPEESDGRQGVRSDHLWYTSPELRRHLEANSPPLISSGDDGWAVRSIADLGFLHAGAPWATLRFHTPPPGNRDWEILGFVRTGTWPECPEASIPAPGFGAVNGVVDINTAGEHALRALFRGIPDWDTLRCDEWAGRLGARLRARRAAPGCGPIVNPGEVVTLLDAPPEARSDFECEVPLRRVANALDIHSLDFTVYALGEARRRGRTTARARLRARILLRQECDAAGAVRLVPSVTRIEWL